jgi:hypothetical protein
MPFLHLGADEFKLIYAHSRHWPGFWQTCTATYRWMRETWAIEKCTGKPLSLCCFSDHVFSEPDYVAALAVTPSFPFCDRKDLLSRSLITHLIMPTERNPHNVLYQNKERSHQDGNLRVLDDFASCGNRWLAGREFRVPRCKAGDYFWVFCAIEAALHGRTYMVNECLRKVGADVVALCGRFLSNAFKCHNNGSLDSKTGIGNLHIVALIPDLDTSPFGFNESIYMAMQMQDPLLLKYIIKNVAIDLMGEDTVNRSVISRLSRNTGMESCLKVLKDYDFF